MVAGSRPDAVLTGGDSTVRTRRRVYLFVVATDALGTGMFLPISVLFFVQARGLSTIAVGTALTASGLLSLVPAPAAARGIERFGSSSLLIWTYLARALLYAGYLGVTNVAEFFVVTFLSRVASSWSRPAQTITAIAIAGQAGRMALLGAARVWRNIAMSAGAAVSAGVLAWVPHAGGYALVAVDALTFLLAAAGMWVLRRRDESSAFGSGDRKGAGVPWREVLAGDSRYILACVARFLSTIQTPMLVVGLPLTVAMSLRHAGGPYGGVALVVNMLLVAAFQIRVSSGEFRVGHWLRVMAIGLGCLALCCIPMGLLPSGWALPLFVAVFVVANTAAEVFVSAGATGISIKLAPQTAVRHLTLFSTFESLGNAVNAGLVAVVLGALGTSGWWLLAGFPISALLLVVTVTRMTDRRSPRAPRDDPA